MKGIVSLKPFTVSDLMGFRFIKIPIDIKNHDSIFGKISLQACLFYAFLLDRMSLSLSNGWYDENGDAYIYYTVDEAKHDMRCSNKTVAGYFLELQEAGLIIKKSRVGKPDRIYVLNSNTDDQIVEEEISKREDNNEIEETGLAAENTGFNRSEESTLRKNIENKPFSRSVKTTLRNSVENKPSLRSVEITRHEVKNLHVAHMNKTNINKTNDRSFNNNIYNNNIASKKINSQEQKQERTNEIKDIINSWNSMMEKLNKTKIVVVTESINSAIKNSLKKYSKEQILNAIKLIAESSYLSSYLGGVKFNWFFKSDNISKVLNGNYTDKTNDPQKINQKNDYDYLKNRQTDGMTEQDLKNLLNFRFGDETTQDFEQQKNCNL